jgi:hypothetical protein
MNLVAELTATNNFEAVYVLWDVTPCQLALEYFTLKM